MEHSGLNTTTLCVKTLAGELKRDSVLRHFSAFGDVKNVRICAFVEFTRAESMTKALESDFHTIAGRRVEVTVADDERTQDETTFWDLNDDCIHEILSTECLSALDLCSVAETSRRLKEIAVGTFKRKHAKCDLPSLANREVKSARRILRNFGAVISDLEIRGWLFEDSAASVLKSVARHCNSTLKSLYLNSFFVPDNFPAKLKPIFNNLQKLKIENCRFFGASKKLFADCGSLVELELSGGDVGFIIENTFPKLQKFKCDSGVESADGTNFDYFILRHKNLTSIAMRNYLKISSLLPLIGDNCKQLEELEFDICGDQTFDLSNFGHLRKLNIGCCHKNIVEVVQGWTNLQFLDHLTLRNVTVNAELIQTLSHLKRLRVLTLKWFHGLENLHRIGDLNQLTELEIDSQGVVALDFVALLKRLSNLKALSVRIFKMHLETYLRIVEVVRARPDKSKLIFRLESYRQQHDSDMLKSFSVNAHIVEMIIEK